MERLVAPLNKRAIFFQSTLLNKTDVLIMKITINCKELCKKKNEWKCSLFNEWIYKRVNLEWI